MNQSFIDRVQKKVEVTNLRSEKPIYYKAHKPGISALGSSSNISIMTHRAARGSSYHLGTSVIGTSVENYVFEKLPNLPEVLLYPNAPYPLGSLASISCILHRTSSTDIFLIRSVLIYIDTLISSS